jgi:hypothetical protein
METKAGCGWVPDLVFKMCVGRASDAEAWT